jgi:hypothetical protein
MLQVSSDAEVSQFHFTRCRQEDVLCFEVAVDDLSIVDVLNRQTNLREPLQY